MPERVHTITSMGADTPVESASEPGSTSAPGSATASAGTPSPDQRAGIDRLVDRVLAIHRPIVVAHLRGIRRRFPTATPDQLVRILERRYLAAVTTGGAAVGATAVIPGIGTGVTLTLSGLETAGFLEATALFAQSVAEVHGIPVDSPDRARALVMTLMLGNEGSDLVRQFAAQAGGGGVARSAYWGELVTNTLPKAMMGTVVDRLRHVFVKQFAVRGGGSVIGKALPFGIGAAIGGIGNHVLARRVLTQSRLAFGAAPTRLPDELESAGQDTLLQATGRRAVHLAEAVGGLAAASARASSRGFRRVGEAAVRRTRRAVTAGEEPDDDGTTDGSEPAPTAAEPDESTGATGATT
ncbi:hypothetical protein ACDF64_16920 [Agromyces sp. MMS24-JH15]|uniref:hypothetical protein n=1 Tax=Agromyces sp. MMS24-JH15 TaxID=3243765 RepID=UPI0037492FED